jgi:hypothetical protein
MSKELKKVTSEALSFVPENERLLAAYTEAYNKKYKDLIIKSSSDDEKVSEAIVKVRSAHKTVSEKRKVLTSEFDKVKKELMQPEKGLKAILDDLTEKRNTFANEQYKAVKAEEKRLQLEANKKQERATLLIDIQSNAKRELAEKMNRINTYLNDQYSKADIDNIDNLIKAGKDKIETIELKGDDYNNLFFSQYQYLSSEEYTDLIAECKNSLSYDKLNADYKNNLKTALNEYVKLLHNKKAQLIELSKISDEKALKEAKEKAKANDEKLRKEKELKAEAEAKKAEMLAEMEKAKATLQAQTGATVATLQAQDAAKSKGSRVKLVGKVNKVSAYPELVATWLKLFCADDDGKKLESFVKAMNRFVNDLANHPDNPLQDIDFVDVEEEIVTSARK